MRDETLSWVKSNYSAEQGNCVEVAVTANGDRLVRDSKTHDNLTRALPADGWHAFVQAVKDS